MTTSDTSTVVAHAAVEHAMRASSDMAAVLAVTEASACSPSALAALGRLVAVSAIPLFPGSPLAVFCQGGELQPAWRDRCGQADRSLWGELEMLRAVYGPLGTVPSDPLDELLCLREISASDMS